MKIILDGHGGDYCPEQAVLGAIQAVQKRIAYAVKRLHITTAHYSKMLQIYWLAVCICSTIHKHKAFVLNHCWQTWCIEQVIMLAKNNVLQKIKENLSGIEDDNEV